MRDVVDDAPADEAIEILLELRSLASFDPSLEAALQRTPYGRQMLDLLAEGAHLRIYEALASDLVRGAAEDLDRLRRALMGRDLIARERAAARIPAAEAELLKWQRALENYRYRREYLEASLAYGMQAFT